MMPTPTPASVSSSSSSSLPEQHRVQQPNGAVAGRSSNTRVQAVGGAAAAAPTAASSSFSSFSSSAAPPRRPGDRAAALALVKQEHAGAQARLEHCLGHAGEELLWATQREERRQFRERVLEAEKEAAAAQSLLSTAELAKDAAQRRLSAARDEKRRAVLTAAIAQHDRSLSARNLAAHSEHGSAELLTSDASAPALLLLPHLPSDFLCLLDLLLRAEIADCRTTTEKNVKERLWKIANHRSPQDSPTSRSSLRCCLTAFLPSRSLLSARSAVMEAITNDQPEPGRLQRSSDVPPFLRLPPPAT
jgi:hypothetical protein